MNLDIAIDLEYAGLASVELRHDFSLRQYSTYFRVDRLRVAEALSGS
jgi:hypothetical protein